MKIEIIGVNTNKLHDELIAAGILPKMVESLDDKTWITVEESQIDAANAIVTAHDPTPLAAPKTELEQLKEDNARLNLQYIDLFELLLAQGVI